MADEFVLDKKNLLYDILKRPKFYGDKFANVLKELAERKIENDKNINGSKTCWGDFVKLELPPSSSLKKNASGKNSLQFISQEFNAPFPYNNEAKQNFNNVISDFKSVLPPQKGGDPTTENPIIKNLNELVKEIVYFYNLYKESRRTFRRTFFNKSTLSQIELQYKTLPERKKFWIQKIADLNNVIKNKRPK